ncbi:MAG: leucine--tRNA ligase [Chitinivibrionales bacterium]|nr:leucine--tRNA ligase [Chitinivibrionales bacterium]
MSEEYDARRIENKWQQYWEEHGSFAASDDRSKKKYYVLIEFPYPSGEGLHVGHPRSYTALDVVARKRRMEGYNVLFPIGWDAFGLPAENFAIKTGRHPREVTQQNIRRFRSQLKRLGFSFDWSREIDTTDPAYYKWTQWIFLKLWKKGLAYKSEMPINWCTSCNVGLANEEVVGGVCERCGGEVVRKVKSQWMLKITDYAERLLQDLETVDFLDQITMQQTNWIGRSTGAEVDFPVYSSGGKKHCMKIFTTRPDTLFGVTYMVLSPEHPLVAELLPACENAGEVRKYVERAANKSDFERTEVVKEVSGVEFRGITALNPATHQEVPVWIADYVLISYGTGAIMAVPGHDERDWRFASRYGLPIVEVISGGDVTREAFVDIDRGTLVNSGPLDGLPPDKAIGRMVEIVEAGGYGRASVQYRLRDWVFSRQRYWGEPIPMVKCPSCGWVPLPESQLPLVLPEVERYKTTDTGESPLVLIDDWVAVDCPQCKGPARRETDTMPQWAGSSWYFLRYTDPHNDAELASQKNLKYWMPVDWYNGGMEHTTLHLLYSRFWHKFLYDIGVVPSAEPYKKRTSHGLILGENGEKMSKSRGNVVNPDEMVDKYGADAFRLYEMFMGAFDQPIPWNTRGLNGMNRFIHRIWDVAEKVSPTAEESRELTTLVHQSIKKVTGDIESMKFNTAIAQLMTLSHALNRRDEVRREDMELFLLLCNPFAPHVCEELWERLGHDTPCAGEAWPQWDEKKVRVDTVTVVIQVNGKLRSRFDAPRDMPKEELEKNAREDAKVEQYISGKTIRKVIVVPNKLVNIVAS